MEYREEHDVMGAVRVPADAYYGAETARAVANFPVNGRTVPPELISAVAAIKRHAAEANRRPNQLSGGMQQRVALARALVNLPKVLLLDEPLGALDLKLRKGLQVELKRIQREVGITFVYVTHDQEEALTMSDRIAIMNRGLVEQIGSPEDVYERPETPFVAGFIGVSNLIPAEQLPGSQNGSGSYACVRPEKLRIEDPSAPPEADHPSVQGQVESTLYLGTATQVIVRVADDVPMTVLVPNADEAERQRLPGAGADVRLAWAPEHMHLVNEREETPQ